MAAESLVRSVLKEGMSGLHHLGVDHRLCRNVADHKRHSAEVVDRMVGNRAPKI